MPQNVISKCEFCEVTLCTYCRGSEGEGCTCNHKKGCPLKPTPDGHLGSVGSE